MMSFQYNGDPNVIWVCLLVTGKTMKKNKKKKNDGFSESVSLKDAELSPPKNLKSSELSPALQAALDAVEFMNKKKPH